jgi:uncharacterized protein (TIGR04141 family)
MSNIETITVYLLKESVKSAGDALRPSAEDYSRHTVRAGETVGTVYVANVEDKEPDWVRLLKSVTQPPVSDYTSSTGALLILPAAGRWFALTFGHGRHLLDSQVYVRRFGLRVALNAADHTRLRGAQARTFSDYALHTSRQVSRLSGVEALELDLERDLVTAVSGAVLDATLGRRVEGRDSVALTAALDVGGFAAACTRLLKESERTTYKQHYPWIDRVEELTDADEIENLELAATTALGQLLFAGFDLFPPELVPEEIVQFRLFPKEGGLIVVEPDASLLRFPLKTPTDAHSAKWALERYKLVGIDTNGDEVIRWSFWECLHHELQQAGSTMVLDGGRWYRVGQDFANQVDQFAKSLNSSGIGLPTAQRGESEGKYNKRVSEATGMALLDQQLVHLVGQSGIEPCDLLSPSGHFVHVKHRKGGSGPLSHLFGQALVSAEYLVGEAEFRERLREKLTPQFAELITEPPIAARYPVVLGLITKSSVAGSPARDLPFFSKVYLRQTVKRLKSMNFEVYVDEIPTPIP